MSRIKTVTIDQKLEIRSLPLISSGDVGTDFFEVRFDSTWQLPDVTFYALFYKTTPQRGTAVQLTEADGVYSCTIPSSMLTAAGRFFFAVYAKNEQGNIIKTSTECHADVVQGAFTGAAIAIDWFAFKDNLITAINDKFGTELAEDISNDDLISAISELVDGNAVREWFIDEYNRQITQQVHSYERLEYFLSLLSDSMTDEHIIASFTQTFRDTADTARNYLNVQDIIAYIITAYNLGYEFTLDDPTADYTLQANAIKNFLDETYEGSQSYNSKYNGLRDDIMLIIPTDDEGIHFDSATPDVDLISAINSAISVKTQIINSMYSLYTGGIVNA